LRPSLCQPVPILQNCSEAEGACPVAFRPNLVRPKTFGRHPSSIRAVNAGWCGCGWPGDRRLSVGGGG
jgi:hypothetical protein